MAAQDKLIPTALTIANNLKGTVYSSGGTYKMPSKKLSKFQNPYIDAIQYFASIYAKELKIAGGDPTWNQTFVDGSNITALFTPNRNIHSLTLGSLIAITEAEWNELQIGISRAFNIVNPFDSIFTAGGVGVGTVAILNSGFPGIVVSAGTHLGVLANNLTGVGIGATFDVVIDATGIISVTPVNPGTGYLVGDTFNFSGTIPGSLNDVSQIVSLAGGTNPYTPVELAFYNMIMGVFSKGSGATAPLLGADGSVLATPAQGVAYATAWNTTKVVYDATLGIVTPFIAPIFKPASQSEYYYRYTGARRWFDFQGYDLY